MSGGRPKKPTILLERHELTKAEKQELIEEEKRLSGGKDLVGTIPPELEGKEIAQQYYEFIIRELEVSEVLSNLDIPLLISVSICLERMYLADEHIREHGQVYETYDKLGNVTLKKNPSVDIYNAFLTQFKSLGTQLGLSPSSRATLAGLNIDKKEESENAVLAVLRGEDINE